MADIYLSIFEIVAGFTLGYLTSFYFHRKDRKNTERLNTFMDANYTFMDANYRMSEDEHRAGHRRGRLKKNPDGTYSIAWEIELIAGIQSSSQLSTEVETKNEQERDSEEPYADPVVPVAIKCPHCGAILPPTGSTCSACGKEFDWNEAYQLYLSHMDEDVKV